MAKKKQPVVVSAYSDMPDRVIFTEEMRKTHTILMPNMLPRHFKIISQVLNNYGYTTELLTDGLNGDSRSVIDAGLNTYTTTPATPLCWSSGSSSRR